MKLKEKIERMNQVVLGFPLWLVVGFSGVFKNLETEGWQEKEDASEPEKMY
jgi:hypothetical protein